MHCDPFFNGVIDEFRIHRSAMSAAQVRALAQGA
ncbi:LamG domain-containing protein [Burkholderia sp. Bp9012]|nr:LamG domain-containing protein [Burkholderia sp. Bp9012]